jgi:hypothetical protein
MDTFAEFAPDPDDPSFRNELTDMLIRGRDAESGDLAVIPDSRTGEYCYVGEVVAATNSTRDGPQSFDENVSIGTAPPAPLLERVHEAQVRLDIGVDSDPQYHIFTHVM